MQNGPNHFPKRPPVSGVEKAINIARSLVALNRGTHGTESAAIAATASQCRLSPAVLRRFVYPSRRPKSVGLDIWQCLRGGYLAVLRKQLAALETEIARVERLGDPDGAVQDLLHKARALQDQAEKLLL